MAGRSCAISNYGSNSKQVSPARITYISSSYGTVTMSKSMIKYAFRIVHCRHSHKGVTAGSLKRNSGGPSKNLSLQSNEQMDVAKYLQQRFLSQQLFQMALIYRMVFVMSDISIPGSSISLPFKTFPFRTQLKRLLEQHFILL